MRITGRLWWRLGYGVDEMSEDWEECIREELVAAWELIGKPMGYAKHTDSLGGMGIVCHIGRCLPSDDFLINVLKETE